MKHKRLINLNLILRNVEKGSNEYDLIEILSKEAGYKNFDKFIKEPRNDELTVKSAMAYLLYQC